MNGRKGLRVCTLGAVLPCALLVGRPYDASGWVTITVNSLADPGAKGLCTLRDAITAANTMTATNGCAAGNGNDTIQFSVTGTILLTSTLPEITDSQLTINGPASPGITIHGGDKVQGMRVASGAMLNLNKLTIANGNGLSAGVSPVCSFPPFCGGGGIFNSGTLTVSHSTFSGNSTFLGGGISNSGTLTVTHSTFSGNAANHGGGIANQGNLTVANSTFSSNSGFEDGCGILNEGTATATVTNSTFSGNNSFDGSGGGISNSGTLTVTHSTFSGNSTRTGAGGIDNFGALTVINSTFFGNSSNGGIAIAGGAVVSTGQ
jgi:CSLREA domain-containing protein